MNPFLTSVGSWLLQYLAGKTLDIAIEELTSDERNESLVYGSGKISRRIRKFIPFIKKPSGVAADLLVQRQQFSDQMFTYYANDLEKLAFDIEGGISIRIAYSHQLYIPDIECHEEEPILQAESGDPYDCNHSIGIERYKESAIEYRIENDGRKDKPYPGPVVRVSDWDGDAKFVLSPADYFDQYVTNQKEIVDTKLQEIIKTSGVFVRPALQNTTLRRLNLKDGKLIPFRVSILSNTIGLAAPLITSDGYLVLPKRERVHFARGYEGASVSGALEWDDGITKDFLSSMEAQISKREGAQELLLNPGTYTLRPLAFAREFERAGKPQFFFVIWADKPFREFKEEWSKSRYPTEEYSAISGIPVFQPAQLALPDECAASLAATLFVLLSSDSVTKVGDVFTVLSEEARASLFYVACWLLDRRKAAFPSHWTP